MSVCEAEPASTEGVYNTPAYLWGGARSGTIRRSLWFVRGGLSPISVRDKGSCPCWVFVLVTFSISGHRFRLANGHLPLIQMIHTRKCIHVTKLVQQRGEHGLLFFRYAGS